MAVGAIDQSSGLQIVLDLDGPRTCMIGAAGKQVPYWGLVGADRKPWGRLCLAFEDEDQVFAQMSQQFEGGFPLVLPHGISRTLRDVEVAEDARVIKVGFDANLVFRLQQITRGAGKAQVPVSLMRERFDVARIVRHDFPGPFELAVVTERALREGLVRCSPGRAVVFGAV